MTCLLHEVTFSSRDLRSTFRIDLLRTQCRYVDRRALRGTRWFSNYYCIMKKTKKALAKLTPMKLVHSHWIWWPLDPNSWPDVKFKSNAAIDKFSWYRLFCFLVASGYNDIRIYFIWNQKNCTSRVFQPAYLPSRHLSQNRSVIWLDPIVSHRALSMISLNPTNKI